MLKYRVSYLLYFIRKEERIPCLLANLQRGNYPTYDEILEIKTEELIDNELSRGFLLLVSKEKVIEILNVEVYPIHMIIQNTIDRYRNEKVKYLLYHNLSFSPVPFRNILINKHI